MNENGSGIKSYHVGLTGVAGSPRRDSYALKMGDETVKPDLSCRIKDVRLPFVLGQHTLK